MNFTNIFIRRPVLAMVLNILILLVGARSIMSLTTSEFPAISSPIVDITTAYPGADANLVRGFVTTPLEQAIAQAEGIDYLRSTSRRGISSIQAHIRLNFPVNDALSQINTKIADVRNDLPPAAEVPTVNVKQSATIQAMYITFHSDTLTRSQVTDYVIRVAQPRFSTVSGVQEAAVIGGRSYAMRIWLDPIRLSAVSVTGADIEDALRRNNFLAGAGSINGRAESFTITVNTSLKSEDEFRELVVAERDGTQIRLGDVARVEMGADNYGQDALANTKPSIFVGIQVAANANLIDTLAGATAAFEDLKSSMPAGIVGRLNYDASVYVEDAISEVARTLIEALIIVVIVIFLFLGSLRATLIPAVAVPLSLVGAGTIMLALGFSINLLTLLAMVLAIGLVVDDAIIVLENIHRHIEEGMTPREAAKRGAAELGGPVIAMTLTLLAVYAPIGFLGGVTGTLFTEFAFTLAATVLVSGVVALTLSPVMCAKLLRDTQDEGRFARWLDRRFEWLRSGYLRVLHRVLRFRILVVAAGLASLVSCYFLFQSIPAELAPLEDNGIMFYSVQTPPNTSLDQLKKLSEPWMDTVLSLPEVDINFHFNGGGGSQTSTAFGGVGLIPSSERERTFVQLLPLIQKMSTEVTGLQIAVFNLAPLPGGGDGLPVQFIITSTDDPEDIRPIADELVAKAWQSGLFLYVDSDLKFDNAQIAIDIDRQAAADLGLSMQQLGSELSAYLGTGFVNRFDLAGRGYKVIAQVERDFRLNPQQILKLPIKTDSGQILPLSAVASMRTTINPRQLSKFQQLNAAAVQAIPAPGVALGDALAFFESEAEALFPRGFAADYAGPSRLFKAEGSSLIATFFFALLIIYLVLAAQFESFRDPFIMLVTVPLSVGGALAVLAMGYATMNIYTQVGLITLIGLISKHGILIVQFANQLREERNIDRLEAVEQACAIRLRPILMTTAAIVLAVIPLVIATGAGAASRSAIGIVIASGMTIGTFFTLFVVPAVYTFVAHRRPASLRGAA